MLKNYLITGGCGFIGRNLIAYLLKTEACKIRVLDNLSVGSKSDLASVCDFVEVDRSFLNLNSTNPINNDATVELIVGDIQDAELAILATKNMNAIVHLAAKTGVRPSVEDPRNDFENNCLGVFNYLEAARVNGIRKFVFASSGASVGSAANDPNNSMVLCKPESPYGCKQAGWRRLLFCIF